MSQLEPVSCDVADEGGPEAREHRGDADARCVGGSATEKPCIYERGRAAGGFANEYQAELAVAEMMLRRRSGRMVPDRAAKEMARGEDL